jgi:hypothetical protein
MKRSVDIATKTAGVRHEIQSRGSMVCRTGLGPESNSRKSKSSRKSSHELVLCVSHSRREPPASRCKIGTLGQATSGHDIRIGTKLAPASLLQFKCSFKKKRSVLRRQYWGLGGRLGQRNSLYWRTNEQFKLHLGEERNLCSAIIRSELRWKLCAARKPSTDFASFFTVRAPLRKHHAVCLRFGTGC